MPSRYPPPPRTTEHATTAPALHVRPDRSGAWHVHAEGEERPLSRHGNETDAERAATRRAAATGAQNVIVHDRYHRVHDVWPGCGRRPLTQAHRPAKSCSPEVGP